MPRDDTRQRILAAAGPIFATEGYERATVRDICDAAGVNLASVNYYFGEKERLYIESVKEAHRMRADQVPQPAWPPGTQPATKLREFLRVFVTRLIGVHGEPWQTRLMMREILQPTQACRELVRDYFRPQFDVLLHILDEILPHDVPVHQRHQIAFSIVGQCVYYRIANSVVSLLVDPDEVEQHFSAQQLAEHISEFSLSALKVSELAGSQRGARSEERGVSR